MKSDKIFDAISDIDDDLIESAEIKSNKKIYGSSWIRWSSAAALFIIAVVILAIGVPLGKNDPPTDDTVSSGIESSYSYLSSESENTDNNIKDVSDEEITTEAGFVKWNGKTVSYDLYNKLKEAKDNDVIPVIVSPIFDSSYVYNGKTIAEYEREMNESKLLAEKLYQLIKDGDDINRYELSGVAESCEDSEYYEERKAFYGKELLSKYIVDGKFLKENAEKDLAAVLSSNDASDAYVNALNSFYDMYRKTVRLTKEEFISYTVNGNTDFIFSLSPE